MIQFSPSLLAVGGARTGIAPVNLLDVEDANGNLYYWADRAINAPSAIIVGSPQPKLPNIVPPVAVPAGQQVAWAYPTTVTILQQPSISNGGLTASLSGMALGITSGSIAGLDSTGQVQWQGFALPSLPPGAVIQALYPVIYGSGNVGTRGVSIWTNGSSQNEALDNLISGGSYDPSSGDVEGEQYGLNIGATETILGSANIGAGFGVSVQGPCDYYLSVSFVAFAVYYSVGEVDSSGNVLSAYKPWLLSVPSFAFHRSLQTDTGSFVVQNISGDTLSRDMEKTLRASAFEGALFVYRLWQADAEAAWLEVHGTLSVEDVGVDTITLKGSQLINPSQDDTPLENYSETCQLQWAGRRCGSTQSTECSYSYQTCQVVERILVVMNDYEKNYGEALANTAQQVINRRRRF